MDITELAKSAGFRVFGDKIVAADEGSSGLATASVKRLVELVKTACATECYERANVFEDLPRDADVCRECGDAIQAL